MYCKHCGKQIDDDAKFCPECGGAVASRSTDADVSNFDQWIDVQEILNACGGNKIEAVKQVKELTGLSLSETGKRSFQAYNGEKYTLAHIKTTKQARAH